MKELEIVKALLKGDEITTDNLESLSNITEEEFYLLIGTLFSKVTNTKEEREILNQQINDIIKYRTQNIQVQLITDIQRTTLINQLLDRLIKGQKLEEKELMLLSSVNIEELLGIVDLYMFKQFALKNKERYLVFYNNLEKLKIIKKKSLEERKINRGI